MNETRLQQEADCTRLCIDFAHYVDARRFDLVLDLFTDDGEFNRRGTVFAGRQEIKRYLESRPADGVIRHLCANIRITLVSPTEATGISYAVFVQR